MRKYKKILLSNKTFEVISNHRQSIFSGGFFLLDNNKKLPDGLHTQIGGNGSLLSGGEKQRLAIARAMYKNPEIYIFDEATSSLDSASEQYVKKAVLELKNADKIIFIIAHRLSTTVDADKIVVLSNGKLIEEGDHYSLFVEGTYYYDLWQKQLPKFRT